MRKLVLIAVLFLGLTFVVRAQVPNKVECPTVALSSPSGIPQSDREVTYTARIDYKGKPLNTKYVWSVTGGEIISRQQDAGSINIKVSKEGSLLVSVEVVGLPTRCPNKASEVAHIESPPEAVRIYEVPERNLYFASTDVGLVIKEMRNHPSDQLYVRVGRLPRYFSIKAIENSVGEMLNVLEANGIDSSRITVERASTKWELIQFWRVPPWAENPNCEECIDTSSDRGTQSCPTLAVTGPPGITQPGELIPFTANVIGNVPKNIQYNWTVSKGQIIEGQGTSSIKVRDDEEDGTTLVATVELISLPEGCAASASEAVPVCNCVEPVLIDEFDITVSKIDKAKLKAAVGELLNNPNNLLYFIEYYRPNVSEFDIRERQQQITEFLIKDLKLTEADFKFVTQRWNQNRMRIYRVPPGAELPTP